MNVRTLVKYYSAACTGFNIFVQEDFIFVTKEKATGLHVYIERNEEKAIFPWLEVVDRYGDLEVEFFDVKGDKLIIFTVGS